ncbi:MAG: recombination-associated protein RdgC [Burkholderiaceae bacterium]|nr:recombination-associated protein RdgC [Burkholderiaceae bacterium]
MFKELTPYRVVERDATAPRLPFAPCGPHEAFSIGFADKPAEAGIEHITIERKVVPPDAVKRKAQALADEIERTTGRRPKGKHLKALKDEALGLLLPVAFPKRKTVPVLWLDDTLLVGTTAAADLDAVLTLLGARVEPLDLARGRLGHWARDESTLPADLMRGQDIVIVSVDDAKATFKATPLTSPEVVDALRPDSVVTSMALATDRMSFTLTAAGQLKGIKLLDLQSGEADAGEAHLWRGELKALLGALA